MSDFKLSIERYLKEQSLIPTIDHLASMKPVSGGTINDAFLTKAIRVPKPIGVGELSNGAFIVIEAIKMRPLYDEALLGKQLALMHLNRGSEKFGLAGDNFIGSTPQPNGWYENWVDFLHMRLEFQFKLAKLLLPAKINMMASELLVRLPEFFKGIYVVPSLWGHHESELGIMRMFGGYSAEFYDAYHSHIPKAPGFDKRVMIYELYHVVNHYNIFGSYLDRCQSLLEGILSNTQQQ
ncbi:hypothetical protein EV175_001859 [Coemansia sp. RSA 1933]|nr:hypothetical protein EV175_001859 [Coemansia sp. RSA 1933]